MRTSVRRLLVKVNALTCNEVTVRRQLPSFSLLKISSTPLRYQSSSSGDARQVQQEAPKSWTAHPINTLKPFDGLPEVVSRVKSLKIAYIAFGSNLTNRVHWIERALRQMELKKYGIKVLRTSSLWETDPMYVLEQDKFLNGVCEVSSTGLIPVQRHATGIY